MTTSDEPAVSPAAQLLLDSAMEFQAWHPDDTTVNDAYFEAQAEHQVRRLIEEGWRPPVTSDATHAARSAAITFALNVVKTGPASRLGQNLVRVVNAMHAAGLLADEGSLRSQASGTPAETGQVTP